MTRPSSGVRFVLEAEPAAPGGGEERVVYRGFAHLPDRDLRLEVAIALPSGNTTAKLADEHEDAAALERTAAALVRAATKQLVQEGRPLPRRISRWRER